MASTTIISNLSGRVEFAFETTDDLARFLVVLERGLDGNTVFNEDIQDLADSIRTLLDK